MFYIFLSHKAGPEGMKRAVIAPSCISSVRTTDKYIKF